MLFAFKNEKLNYKLIKYTKHVPNFVVFTIRVHVMLIITVELDVNENSLRNENE